MARVAVSELTLKTTFDAEAPQRAKVGDVVQSTLTEAQFQAQRDSTWVLMDGRDVTGSDYDTIVFNGLGGNIPDARGQFLRGKDHGRHLIDGKGNPDGDLALGTYTTDAIRNITGKYGGGRGLVNPTPAGAFAFDSVNNTAGPNNGGSSEINFNFDASRVVPVAADNRPKNTTVNIFIKINE